MKFFYLVSFLIFPPSCTWKDNFFTQQLKKNFRHLICNALLCLIMQIRKLVSQRWNCHIGFQVRKFGVETQNEGGSLHPLPRLFDSRGAAFEASREGWERLLSSFSQGVAAVALFGVTLLLSLTEGTVNHFSKMTVCQNSERDRKLR